MKRRKNYFHGKKMKIHAENMKYSQCVRVKKKVGNLNNWTIKALSAIEGRPLFLFTLEESTYF